MTPVAPLTDKPQFGGSVELSPERPLLIEFVDNKQIWGFPIALLDQFVLGANTKYDCEETTPPHRLTLDFATAVVTLIGWRLDMMLGPLSSGRIARVQTVPATLAGLTVEEPWVTELCIHELRTPWGEEYAKPTTIPPKT